MCTPVRTWLLLSPRFPASLAWQHGLGREGLLLSHSSKHCCNHLTQNRVREEYFRQNVSWLLKFVSWLKLKKFQEIKILLDRLKKINSEKRHRNVNLNVFFLNNGDILLREFQNWLHLAFLRFEVPDNWNASLWAQELDFIVVEFQEVLKYSVLATWGEHSLREIAAGGNAVL